VNPPDALIDNCSECGSELAPGLLACPRCARLLYGADLEKLAASAKAAAQAGDATGELASWRRAIDLLPAGTTQRKVIHDRMRALSAIVDGRQAGAPGARKRDPNGKTKAGAAAGTGAVGVALLKSKALLAALLANGKLLLVGLLKVPTLLSMLIYAGFWTRGGAAFGIGLVASIYVHEIGHVAALRRYGIEASAPMFIPGFGALVRLKQYPTDAHEDARTGLAGPLWGLFAAAVAALVGFALHSPTAIGVASLGATINCFNLIPVWQLDGSRGLRALSRLERAGVAAVGVVAGLVFHQWMPAIVGLVAGGRSFGADVTPEGDRPMTFLFGTLIAAHALIATLPIGLGH
jgi:Zn-dependent protease